MYNFLLSWYYAIRGDLVQRQELVIENEDGYLYRTGFYHNKAEAQGFSLHPRCFNAGLEHLADLENRTGSSKQGTDKDDVAKSPDADGKQAGDAPPVAKEASDEARGLVGPLPGVESLLGGSQDGRIGAVDEGAAGKRPGAFGIRWCHTVEPEEASVAVSAGTLYIFLFSKDVPKKDIVARHRGILRDERVFAVVVEKAVMQLLFNSVLLEHPQDIIHFRTQSRKGLLERLMSYTFVLGALCIGYFIGLRIVMANEKNDPSYEDFSINSTAIVQYKALRARQDADGEAVSCTICFEEFESEDEVRLLRCGHFFHPECVDIWLIGHLSCCPFCRQEIEVVEKV